MSLVLDYENLWKTVSVLDFADNNKEMKTYLA